MTTTIFIIIVVIIVIIVSIVSIVIIFIMLYKLMRFCPPKNVWGNHWGCLLQRSQSVRRLQIIGNGITLSTNIVLHAKNLQSLDICFFVIAHSFGPLYSQRVLWWLKTIMDHDMDDDGDESNVSLACSKLRQGLCQGKLLWAKKKFFSEQWTICIVYPGAKKGFLLFTLYDGFLHGTIPHISQGTACTLDRLSVTSLGWSLDMKC